jgi:hypothetical protein
LEKDLETHTINLQKIEKYKQYQESIPTTITNAKFIGIFDIGTLSDGFHPSVVQARQIANIIINAL